MLCIPSKLRTVVRQERTSGYKSSGFHLVFQLFFFFFFKEKAEENLEEILQGKINWWELHWLWSQWCLLGTQRCSLYFNYWQCKWKTHLEASIPYCFRHKGSQGWSQKTFLSLVIRRKSTKETFLFKYSNGDWKHERHMNQACSLGALYPNLSEYLEIGWLKDK